MPEADSAAMDMIDTLSGAEHHAAAADHHDRAASHHRRASKHYLANDHALAARQAIIAHGHMQEAVRHGNEATQYHLEHDRDSSE